MLRFGLTRGCAGAVCLLLMRVGACFWQRLPWVAWICVVVVILVVGDDFLSGSLECWFVKSIWLV